MCSRSPAPSSSHGGAGERSAATPTWSTRWRRGVPGRAVGGRLYFVITTPSQIEPHNFWASSRSGRGSGHLGRDRLRRARRPVGAPAAPANPRRPAIHGRGRAGAAGGTGDRADRELLQPGAVRQALHAPLGAEDLAGPPPDRLREFRHVPALVPIRDHLESVAGRRPGLARQPPADQAAGVVRAVRRGLFGLSDLRGDDPDRLLEPHPRYAAELLDRVAAVPGRPRVVRADPAARDHGTWARGRAARRLRPVRPKRSTGYRKPPATTYGKK